MPFADYENFEACERANSDKNDPEAYCAEIHYQATGEYPGQKSAADYHSDPIEYTETALEAMKAVGKSPTEERMAEISVKAQELAEEDQEW